MVSIGRIVLRRRFRPKVLERAISFYENQRSPDNNSVSSISGLVLKSHELTDFHPGKYFHLKFTIGTKNLILKEF